MTIEHEEQIDISPDNILRVVQMKRMKMLLGKEKIEKDSRYLMNELAETAVACKKIESDENIAKDENDISIEIIKAIGQIGANPFHRSVLGEGVLLSPPEPEVPTITLVPGENSTDQEELDYSNFITNRKK